MKTVKDSVASHDLTQALDSYANTLVSQVLVTHYKAEDITTTTPMNKGLDGL